jgi:aspartate/methionine/tyrosine aminotransferase
MKLPPFRLEHYFAKYEFKAPYFMSGSDSQSMTIGDLLSLQEGAAEEFQRVWLGYTESYGDPGLRDSISRLYESMSPEDILVHSGAEEVIFTFLSSVLQPGDHVIVS